MRRNRLGKLAGRKVCLRLKHGNVLDEHFDPLQLAMGIKVEMEHTVNRAVAKQVAKAHLVEMPDYYTHLKRMEQGVC